MQTSNRKSLESAENDMNNNSRVSVNQYKTTSWPTNPTSAWFSYSFCLFCCPEHQNEKGKSGLVYLFLGSLISKCLGFLASQFLVSCFQGLLASKLQSFNDPILPNFDFTLSGRYWSHIADIQDFIRRIVAICWCPSFLKFSNLWTSKILRFIQIIFLKMIWDAPWCFEVSWGLQRWK